MKSACQKKKKVFYREIAPLVKKKKMYFKILVRSPWRLKYTKYLHHLNTTSWKLHPNLRDKGN